MIISCISRKEFDKLSRENICFITYLGDNDISAVDFNEELELYYECFGIDLEDNSALVSVPNSDILDWLISDSYVNGNNTEIIFIVDNQLQKLASLVLK